MVRKSGVFSKVRPSPSPGPQGGSLNGHLALASGQARASSHTPTPRRLSAICRLRCGCNRQKLDPGGLSEHCPIVTLALEGHACFFLFPFCADTGFKGDQVGGGAGGGEGAAKNSRHKQTEWGGVRGQFRRHQGRRVWGGCSESAVPEIKAGRVLLGKDPVTHIKSFPSQARRPGPRAS